MPPAVEPRSPKHWKARDSPPKNFFKLKYCGGGGLVAKSCLTLAIPWTVACQAPLSMGFSRQEYWSGVIRELKWVPFKVFFLFHYSVVMD